jgi:DNA polymerase delta subunit 1
MAKRNQQDSNNPRKKFKNDQFFRPPVGSLNPNDDTLIFQELELDHYLSRPYPGMPGAQTGMVPVIRMFGVTKVGNSVCCHIHGFSPYFYVNLPDNFEEAEMYLFKEKLNDAVVADMRSNKDNITEAVLMMELLKGKSLVEYQGEEDGKFAKITLALPKFVAAAKRLLTTTIVYQPLANHTFYPFESNVDIETRFMVDTNILGCCWIELPAGKWFRRPQNSYPVTSRCQLEVDVSWTDFISHSPEGEWSPVARFRIHSFDIECAGRKGIFPEPNVDPIIQIANVVKLHGDEEVVTRNIFTLKSCAPIGHAEVRSFETEGEMLEEWAAFVREMDPDIFTGYNINNFDFPYLIERARHLKLKRFDFLGRILDIRSTIKETVTQTKIGRRTFKSINFEGRVPYDMLMVIKRDFKLRSYTLNSVCQEILGEQKEDVHYSIITDLQNGDEQTRRRLAVYCLKDAELPVRLLNTVRSFTNDVEMARVTGVPITSLLTKGEQVKVVAQLLKHARKAGYFMPAHQGAASSEQYEGATVIEPMRGYYTDPIVTLDFSSLYPSIMIAHNLCYTTLIKPNVKEKLSLTDEQVTTTPANCMFVKSSVRPGLLPHILQHLLAARKKTKAELKEATDPVVKAVLDGRQLAYKISANSVYGFTGAQVGKLPCLEISSVNTLLALPSMF